MTTVQSSDIVELGRKLGHDLFRFRRPMERTALPASVAEGIASAEARRPARESADRFVCKWLQLRLNALRRMRTVDDQVTPDFLRRIDVARCPITRVDLTHGLLLESDWSVDRINNDGGYARSNLAVMSVAANKAKGNRSFDEVLDRSQRPRMSDGLLAVEWLRMASLMLGPCFVDPASRIPLLPLLAVAPCTVQPAVQVIQYVFTKGAGPQAGKNALIKQFRPACRGEASLHRLERFAEAMHRALKHATPCWDAWLRPDVMTAFVAWHRAMDAHAWSLAGRVAARVCGGRRVDARGLESWQLERHGYLQ